MLKFEIIEPLPKIELGEPAVLRIRLLGRLGLAFDEAETEIVATDVILPIGDQDAFWRKPMEVDAFFTATAHFSTKLFRDDVVKKRARYVGKITIDEISCDSDLIQNGDLAELLLHEE